MGKRTLILAVGFVLFWNSGFIGAEYGLPYAGPFSLLFWRYLGLTAIIFLYLLLSKRFQWVPWSIAAPNMLVGVLAHGVWLSCVLLALDQEVPAGIVALVVALQPLATGAFSGMVVGEPTPWFRWLGLIIGFIGVTLSVIPRIDFGDAASVFGYLIPLGSVIGITAASLIQRKMQVNNSTQHLPVDLALFYQSLATTLVLAIPAVFAENLAAEWTTEFIYTMLWLVIGVSLGAYALMWFLIERMDATRVASLFYLGPPVTMLMAWIAFGDIPAIMDIIGLTVVFAGVMITQMKVSGQRV
ncbi:MAG: DMT family transporter [Bacteroidales bacterium]|nr:DMT family transporter [Bacteroidales bacterium]